MYYVYILKSSRDSKYYTGITDNIERRLKEHSKGQKSTRSTLNRGPFELIHVEITDSRNQARILEKFLKSGLGREIRDEIIKSWWL